MNKLFRVTVYYEIKSVEREVDSSKRFNVVCETDVEARDWSCDNLMDVLVSGNPKANILIKYCEMRIICNIDHIVEPYECTCGENEACPQCPDSTVKTYT